MPHERTVKGSALPTDPGCCAGRLLRALAPITSAARVMDALELFTANPELVAIPVVDDGVPTGLINRKQITPEQFTTQESGAVLMSDDCRKTVLEQWQKRKQEEITHPVLDEKMPLGLAFHVQAQLLARHLRGDSDFYPASVWK